MKIKTINDQISHILLGMIHKDDTEIKDFSVLSKYWIENIHTIKIEVNILPDTDSRNLE